MTERLVVAPHMDDESFACGGLLAKYPGSIAVVVVTEPDTEQDPKRRREFYRAMKTLGVAHWETLLFPDCSGRAVERELVAELDRVMAEHQPRELYLPTPGVHQDHIATYEAGVRSARLSMSKGHHYPPCVLLYDDPTYDLQLDLIAPRWDMFEILTEEQIDLKVRACREYRSQTVEGPHPANGLKEHAADVGRARGVAYAEQYQVVRWMR